jgi:hypothetical protein
MKGLLSHAPSRQTHNSSGFLNPNVVIFKWLVNYENNNDYIACLIVYN